MFVRNFFGELGMRCVSGEELGFFLGECACRWAKRNNEKRFEDMSQHLHQEEDAQTFFNKRSLRKQSIFKPKGLRGADIRGREALLVKNKLPLSV
ncbi:hypothetical protein HanPI659440_Chr07g0267671 [Helianthus annuus]|nr:hypothetical protein HanPI659440_Chr07g0267671 [Helianthus annuus]